MRQDTECDVVSPQGKLSLAKGAVCDVVSPQVKLSLAKELCQTLPARMVPSHLAAMAAAAAALNSAFPLRSGATLFQTHSLPAALLRPAPGPVRTAHAPMLFAPY